MNPHNFYIRSYCRNILDLAIRIFQDNYVLSLVWAEIEFKPAFSIASAFVGLTTRLYSVTNRIWSLQVISYLMFEGCILSMKK